MTTELSRQAEQLYKDLEPEARQNPNAMASEVTVKICNAILDEAKKSYGDKTMIAALPLASDGTTVSDLLKIVGQLKENIPLDSSAFSPGWVPPDNGY